MFKLIIAGDHNFKNAEKLAYFCDKVLSRKKQIEVVLNGIPSIGSIAESYARDRQFYIKHFGRQWLSSQELSYYRQNVEMCIYADALIAFWNEENRHTKSLINSAKVRNLKIRVCRYRKYRI